LKLYPLCGGYGDIGQVSHLLLKMKWLPSSHQDGRIYVRFDGESDIRAQIYVPIDPDCVKTQKIEK
jgi:hypothetical protein